MNELPDVFGTAPLYAVLFSSSQDIDAPFSPVVVSRGSEPIVDDQAFVTVPHGLSREMATALPGLWYCLHLPNSFFQLTDLSYSFLKDIQGFALGHQFFFAPVQIF